MQSESRCISLTLENKALRRQLNQPQARPQQAQISTISEIHAPLIQESQQPESLSLLGQQNVSAVSYLLC